MAGRYRTRGGYTVEAITLSGTPDKRDGQWTCRRLPGCHHPTPRTWPGVAALDMWSLAQHFNTMAEPDVPEVGQ
jgi:hypothetical protein